MFCFCIYGMYCKQFGLLSNKLKLWQNQCFLLILVIISHKLVNNAPLMDFPAEENPNKSVRLVLWRTTIVVTNYQVGAFVER